jgi:zinc protease
MESFKEHNDMNIDRKLIVKTLDNGFKYFTYYNDSQKNMIRISLVVKAGSLMENDNEIGIAHFIEHMCIYNNYRFLYEQQSNNNVRNSLLIGYTNFYETVYSINCKSEELNNYLPIFKNILSGDNILKSNINHIKHEVIDEISRETCTANYKLKEIILPEIVNKKIFKNKLPLGNLESIKNISYESIMKFHSNWYKTQNSALFIVGQTEECNVKDLIENYFSRIQKSSENFRIPIAIEKSLHRKILINTIKNLEYNEIQFYYLKSSLYSNEIKYDLETKILEYFCLTLIERDICTMFSKNKLDFSKIEFVSRRLMYNFNFNILQLDTDKNFYKKIKYIIQVIKKLSNFGFTKQEFDRYRELFLLELTEYYNRAKLTINNKDLTKECIDNYLYDEPIISLNREYSTCLSIISTISFEEINMKINKILSSNNVLISINCKESLDINKKDLYNLLQVP